MKIHALITRNILLLFIFGISTISQRGGPNTQEKPKVYCVPIEPSEVDKEQWQFDLPLVKCESKYEINKENMPRCHPKHPIATKLCAPERDFDGRLIKKHHVDCSNGCTEQNCFCCGSP